MSTKGSFSLSITSENLNFQEIKEVLNIESSSTTKKGTIISKTTKQEAPFDIWRYEVKFNNDIELYNALGKLLVDLDAVNKQILMYTQRYEVKLSCYLRSEYGQMGLEISPKFIDSIAKLGVGLDIHILSFGGVEE